MDRKFLCVLIIMVHSSSYVLRYGAPFFEKETLEPNRVGNNTKKIMVIRGSVTLLFLHDSGLAY